MFNDIKQSVVEDCNELLYQNLWMSFYKGFTIYKNSFLLLYSFGLSDVLPYKTINFTICMVTFV